MNKKAKQTRKDLTAMKLWQAIKWSNQNNDGSITMCLDRVKSIDELLCVNREDKI